MLIENVKVLFLKAEKFDFKGTTGTQVVAFNCRFLYEGVVYKAKITEAVYQQVQDIVQEEIVANLKLESRKEIVSLRLESIVSPR